MFFDGNFKKRNTISLRGSSTTQQKEDLVLKAQQERAERDLQRRKEASSRRVQAFYRGRKDVEALRDRLRYAFDAELKGGADASVVLAQLRALVFFFRPSHDLARFERLCAALPESSEPSPGLLEGPAQRKEDWIRVFRGFILISFGVISNPSSSAEAKRRAADAASLLLLWARPTEAQQGFQAALFQRVAPQIPREMRSFWLQNPKPDPSISRFFAALAERLVRMAIEEQGSEAASHFFLFEMFSIPDLPARLGGTPKQFLKGLPFIDFLHLCRTHWQGWTSEARRRGAAFSAEAFFANFLTLSNEEPIPSHTKPPAAAGHRGLDQEHLLWLEQAQVMRLIIASLPPSADPDLRAPGLRGDAEGEGVGADSDTEMEEPSQAAPSPVQETIHSGLTSSHLVRGLNSLLEHGDLESQLVVLALYADICFRFKKERFDFLNRLCFEGTQAIQHLWGAVQRHEAFKELLAGSTRGLLSGESRGAGEPRLLLLFSLLMLLFGHLLLILNDEDFHSEKTGIPLGQVVHLISGLKTLASDAFRSESTFEDSTMLVDNVTFATFKTLLVKLLGQLHDRDTRRQFCPTNFWLTRMDVNFSNLSTQFLDLFDHRQALDEEEMERDELDDEDMIDLSSLPKLPSQAMGSHALRAAENSIAVLKNVPFMVSFEERVMVLRQLVLRDRQISQKGRKQVRIRRSAVFQDGFAEMNGLGTGLRGRLQITFVDDYGIEEPGIDGGGLFKEFMNLLIEQGFHPTFGLFQQTPAHNIYPSPKAFVVDANARKKFEFLGRMVGKCIYDGIIVELPFAGFFLNRLLGRKNLIDDLPFLDPDLYRNLLYVKNYQGDVRDLMLYFCVTEDDFGKTRVVDLVPGGRDILVTNDTRIPYIYRIVNYKLNSQIEAACSAFLTGLSDLINPEWLKLFDQRELQILISGAESRVDLDDLRAHTAYYSDYSADHPLIRWFWEALDAFSEHEKSQLLQFVTSCSKPPLLGFKELSPPFAISPVDDSTRLPTASTCVNLLKLPRYPSREVLAQKLRLSITSKAGFDLS